MSRDLITNYSLTFTSLILSIISISVSFVFVLIIIYYLFKFLRLRQHPFILKRYPYLITIYVCFNILFLLIERTLSVLIHSGIYTNIWFEWMRWIFFTSFIHGGSFVLLLRIYLVFYNVQWTKLNDNHQWIFYINKINQKNKNENNFFIKCCSISNTR